MKKRKHKIILEVGKFYRVLDGSPGGHPGQIYKIDNQQKLFYSFVTGSMSEEEFKRLGLRKGYYRLKYPTDKHVDISLVKKRPFAGDRDDYGDKAYDDMSFADDDYYLLIRVSKNNPIYGKNYKKKKSSRNGATHQSVSRHHTSGDHDHIVIKTKND